MGISADGNLVIDENYNYQEITTEIDKKRVVTSASIETSHDLTLYQGNSQALARAGGYFPVPRDADLFVHGDVVRVRGRIEAPGRTIRIVCRRLLGDSQDAAIIVDGRAGAAPSAAGKAAPGPAGRLEESQLTWRGGYAIKVAEAKAGAPGEAGRRGDDGAAGLSGGVIEIFCQEVDTWTHVLTLRADGGGGGVGQAGQGGGDGGPGADGADDEWDGVTRKRGPCFGALGGPGWRGWRRR